MIFHSFTLVVIAVDVVVDVVVVADVEVEVVLHFHNPEKLFL